MLKRPIPLGVLTAVVILAATIIPQAQTIDDVTRLISRGQLDSAEFAAGKIMARDRSSLDAFMIMTKVLWEKGKYADARNYLEQAKSLTGIDADTKAGILLELSSFYFAEGDYQKSKESLAQCQASGATPKLVEKAAQTALNLGFDKFYESWTVRETDHFVFHIQDTAALKNMNLFIKMKEQVFDSISSFLNNVKLPKKIDYFVWSDGEQATSMLRRQLAFTKSALCLTHTRPRNTLGHEMTHSLSYYAAKPRFSAPLIAEGICVFLDHSRRTNASILRGKGEAIGPIADVWKNDKRLDEDLLYPLGGELVRRLLKAFGKEKFMQLLANQSYQRAKQIYGDKLDLLIARLEADLRK